VKILYNELMSRRTTFKVGGPADKFIIIDSEQEFKEIITFPGPIFILGNGSNLIVRDKGIRGTVIKYIANKIKIEGNIITADAGVMLRKLAEAALENNLTGLEFVKKRLHLAIPGGKLG
jgi:UDP-N-acetylmuramate dehydrogenase